MSVMKIWKVWFPIQNHCVEKKRDWRDWRKKFVLAASNIMQKENSQYNKFKLMLFIDVQIPTIIEPKREFILKISILVLIY